MTAHSSEYSFGSVPSRRLGQSLGINNIPAKICTYSCVYCQVGRTRQWQIDRREFYEPDDIFQDVQGRLAKVKKAAGQTDYLTFVPDGEPTLDANLGKEIDLLRVLGIPIGVITNSSLIWRDDVREELGKANWVSVKIDAVQEKDWRRINRPHKAIRLSQILDGIQAFASAFTGELVTETMLVGGINDNDAGIKEVAEFIHELQPSRAYLSIPTRPPAVRSARAPDEETLNRVYHMFQNRLKQVEYLIGYEGDAFAFTGEVERDLLSITAVHPMRKEAVSRFLSRAGASWPVIDRLVADGRLVATSHEGHVYYLRRFTTARKVTS